MQDKDDYLNETELGELIRDLHFRPMFDRFLSNGNEAKGMMCHFFLHCPNRVTCLKVEFIEYLISCVDCFYLQMKLDLLMYTVLRIRSRNQAHDVGASRGNCDGASMS